MATKASRFCAHPGCNALIPTGRYCQVHAPVHDDARRQRKAEHDKRRGSARERGYTSRWSTYSRWYLKQPENQFCTLRLDSGCAIVSQCVDHIMPHNGPGDPLLWDTTNHQAACIHCNSVKGRRYLRGVCMPGAGDDHA